MNTVSNSISAGQISNELYDALPEDVRLKLEQLKIRRTVPAGTILMERGVAPHSVMFVEKGNVEITLTGEDRSLHLAIAGPGKVFGLRVAVAEVLPEINVRCLVECTISEVPRDQFLDAVRANGKAYIAIARVLSADLRMAKDLRRRLAARDAKLG